MNVIDGASVSELIGISEERHDTVVKKAYDKCVVGTVDTALLKLSSLKDLDNMEKLYVAFRIGKLAAVSEIDAKTGGIGKRLGLFQ